MNKKICNFKIVYARTQKPINFTNFKIQISCLDVTMTAIKLFNVLQRIQSKQQWCLSLVIDIFLVLYNNLSSFSYNYLCYVAYCSKYFNIKNIQLEKVHLEIELSPQTLIFFSIYLCHLMT